MVAGQDSSISRNLSTGVPQGSILGPRMFISYGEDVSSVFESLGLHIYHLFADDMQSADCAKPELFAGIVSRLQACVQAVDEWCATRRLQLNTAKTEVLWFGSSTNLRKLSSTDTRLQVGEDILVPSNTVRDLGVYLDPQLSMKFHIAQVSRICFFHLRRLRPVRHLLGRDVTARLVSAFVLSRLDYCNATLAGLPTSTLAPLQRVLNAAARLVLDLKPWDHVTSALRSLHWLPIRQRIDYKLCLLVHQSLLGSAPSYLSSILSSVADVPGRASLRSAASNSLITLRTRLKTGERAFAVAGPMVWNRLPNEN